MTPEDPTPQEDHAMAAWICPQCNSIDTEHYEYPYGAVGWTCRCCGFRSLVRKQRNGESKT